MYGHPIPYAQELLIGVRDLLADIPEPLLPDQVQLPSFQPGHLHPPPVLPVASDRVEYPGRCEVIGAVLAHDGTTGYIDHAPFDAIMVTACAPHLPPLLVSQLKDGGYLLIPVTKGRDQILYRYRRRGEEVQVEQSVSCRFVPLLGGVTRSAEETAAAAQNENPAADQGDRLA